MIKGVVIGDNKGYKIAISEDWIKAHGIYRRNGMFWAIDLDGKYEDGDWCDLAFFPYWDGMINEETGEAEFCTPIYVENTNVCVGRHFYHNDRFVSGWESDRPNWIDIDPIEWVDIEPLKIAKVL